MGVNVEGEGKSGFDEYTMIAKKEYYIDIVTMKNRLSLTTYKVLVVCLLGSFTSVERTQLRPSDFARYKARSA